MNYKTILFLALADILICANGQFFGQTEDIRLAELLSDLQARVIVLEHTIDDLMKKVDRQDIELRDARRTRQIQDSRLKRTTLRSFGPQNVILGAGGSDEVGFHATLSNKATLHDMETIAFDKTITNMGSGYNTTSGQLVCPQSGTYLFNLNILSSSKSSIEADIINVNNNGQTILKTISYNRDGSYRQGAGSAIVKLTKGDVILVRKTARVGPQTILNDYSYFSYYLLRPS